MEPTIDVNNLNYTLALLIKPLLEQYKKEMPRIPSTLYHYKNPSEEWHNRIDKMINAFDCLIEMKGERPSSHDAIYIVFSGLRLFSEHYLDM